MEQNVASDDVTTLSAFAEKAAQQTSLPSTESRMNINVNREESLVEGNEKKSLVKKRGRPPKAQNNNNNTNANGEGDGFDVEAFDDEGKKEDNEGKRKRGASEGDFALSEDMSANAIDLEEENMEDVTMEGEVEVEEKKKRGTRSKIVRWTPREDELLLKIVPSTIINEENPFFWRSIAKQLPGKTINQCFQHWNRVLNPKIKKGAWDPEEEAELATIVEKLRGDVRHLWSRVAAMTQGRIDTQCRYQMRIIEKSGSVAWEKVEDNYLMHTINSEERGDSTAPKDWVKIAQKFNNKMSRATTRKTPVRCSLHCKTRYEWLNGATDFPFSGETAGTSVLESVESIIGLPQPEKLINAPAHVPIHRGPVPSKVAHGSYPYAIGGGVSNNQVGRLMGKGQNVVQVAADAVGLRDPAFSQYESNPAQGDNQQPFVESHAYSTDQTQPTTRYNNDLELGYDQFDANQQIARGTQEDSTGSAQPYQSFTAEQQQASEYTNQEYEVSSGTAQEPQGHIYNQNYNENYS